MHRLCRNHNFVDGHFSVLNAKDESSPLLVGTYEYSAFTLSGYNNVIASIVICQDPWNKVIYLLITSFYNKDVYGWHNVVFRINIVTEYFQIRAIIEV